MKVTSGHSVACKFQVSFSYISLPSFLTVPEMSVPLFSSTAAAHFVPASGAGPQQSSLTAHKALAKHWECLRAIEFHSGTILMIKQCNNMKTQNTLIFLEDSLFFCSDFHLEYCSSHSLHLMEIQM